MSSLAARLAASDALAIEMTRLRIAIVAAEHEGQWLLAGQHRQRLKELHATLSRRDYRAEGRLVAIERKN